MVAGRQPRLWIPLFGSVHPTSLEAANSAAEIYKKFKIKKKAAITIYYVSSSVMNDFTNYLLFLQTLAKI